MKHLKQHLMQHLNQDLKQRLYLKIKICKIATFFSGNWNS